MGLPLDLLRKKRFMRIASNGNELTSGETMLLIFISFC